MKISIWYFNSALEFTYGMRMNSKKNIWFRRQDRVICAHPIYEMRVQYAILRTANNCKKEMTERWANNWRISHTVNCVFAFLSIANYSACHEHTMSTHSHEWKRTAFCWIFLFFSLILLCHLTEAFFIHSRSHRWKPVSLALSKLNSHLDKNWKFWHFQFKHSFRLKWMLIYWKLKLEILPGVRIG